MSPPLPPSDDSLQLLEPPSLCAAPSSSSTSPPNSRRVSREPNWQTCRRTDCRRVHEHAERRERRVCRLGWRQGTAAAARLSGPEMQLLSPCKTEAASAAEAHELADGSSGSCTCSSNSSQQKHNSSIAQQNQRQQQQR
eukprot:365603-Chlamydomonas_euryale.AAC.23